MTTPAGGTKTAALPLSQPVLPLPAAVLGLAHLTVSALAAGVVLVAPFTTTTRSRW